MASQTYSLQCYCFDTVSQTYIPRVTARQVGVNDVLIHTTHSGLCYTDVHAKVKGCGLGHEGVGIVKGVGDAVRNLHVGDRVGWGWLHSSCGHCKTCVSGYRQYCSEAQGFAFSDLDQGAFGDMRIMNSAFVYGIPAAISSVDAGPFMCAGASVFEALDAAGTRSSHRVGVVGIGGLGSMAILFSKAMGCSVTAITVSGNSGKEQDVRLMGADRYHSLATKLADTPGDIDVLLITSNKVPDLEQLLPLLARRATIALMTIQQDPLAIPYMPFILPGHRLIASTEASRENHIAMLDFAARHAIKPWIQTFPMTPDGIAEAFRQLESSKMRYRGVLVREDES